MRSTALVMVLALVLVAGCARKAHVGSVIGGTMGGVLGAQIGTGAGQVAATTAGGLGGSYIGGEIGRAMEEADRRRVQESLERSPTGRPVAWKNPDTGVAYEVTPTRTYDSEGMPCREYTTEAWIDGEREVVTDTACRQPDGTWEAI